MDISLNFVDKAIADTIFETTEFKEFYNTMNHLEMVLDSELYTEAVASTNKGNKIKQAAKNTKDSIGAVGTAYSNTTDAGGNILNATWRVVMASIKMVSKILKWASKYVSRIPLFVADAIEGAINIPSNVVNKIKGNIKLYITIEDLYNIFSVSSVTGDYSIINRLNMIIQDLNKLSKGQLWSTYITKKSNIAEFFKQITDDEKNGYIKLKSDMALIKNINKQYNYIKGIKFNQSVIEMNNPKIVETYFGKTPSIKFKDHEGKERNETYLGGLKALSDFLDHNSEVIKTLEESLNDKLTASFENSSYVQLSPSNQKLIGTLFQTISKTIEVIGNISRYIIIDIKTIEKERNQIKASKVMENYKEENTEKFKPSNFLQKSLDAPQDAKDRIYDIRGALMGYISADHKFETNDFENAIKYVLNHGVSESELYEKYSTSNIPAIDQNKDKWDENYYAHARVYLKDNFCKERINHIKEVARYIYKN